MGTFNPAEEGVQHGSTWFKRLLFPIKQGNSRPVLELPSSTGTGGLAGWLSKKGDRTARGAWCHGSTRGGAFVGFRRWQRGTWKSYGLWWIMMGNGHVDDYMDGYMDAGWFGMILDEHWMVWMTLDDELMDDFAWLLMITWLILDDDGWLGLIRNDFILDNIGDILWIIMEDYGWLTMIADDCGWLCIWLIVMIEVCLGRIREDCGILWMIMDD